MNCACYLTLSLEVLILINNSWTVAKAVSLLQCARTLSTMSKKMDNFIWPHPKKTSSWRNSFGRKFSKLFAAFRAQRLSKLPLIASSLSVFWCIWILNFAKPPLQSFAGQSHRFLNCSNTRYRLSLMWFRLLFNGYISWTHLSYLANSWEPILTMLAGKLPCKPCLR